jgi:hypothetical protein
MSTSLPPPLTQQWQQSVNAYSHQFIQQEPKVWPAYHRNDLQI